MMNIFVPRDIDMRWSGNIGEGMKEESLRHKLWMREFKIPSFLPPIF